MARGQTSRADQSHRSLAGPLNPAVLPTKNTYGYFAHSPRPSTAPAPEPAQDHPPPWRFMGCDSLRKRGEREQQPVISARLWARLGPWEAAAAGQASGRRARSSRRCAQIAHSVLPAPLATAAPHLQGGTAHCGPSSVLAANQAASQLLGLSPRRTLDGINGLLTCPPGSASVHATLSGLKTMISAHAHCPWMPAGAL